MNVLVISAHPDDETLGCGGTLLKHAAAGDRLHWLVATQAHEPQWSPAVVAEKQAEVARVAKAYDMAEHVGLGFKAGQLDVVPKQQLIDAIRRVAETVQPEHVYLVHGGDVHTDHQAVFTATMAALKPFRMSRLGVRRVLCYETLSSTDAAPALRSRVFVPSCFSDITQFLDQKLNILKLYQSEVQASPLPRSPEGVRALAKYRGATIGVEYAEALMVIREIV